MNVTCKICGLETNTNGMATHLKYTHKMQVNEYVSKYEEYRPKYKTINSKLEENEDKFKCKICNEPLYSEKTLSYHIRQKHNIKKNEYILKYIFNNKQPTCECGCGTEISIINQHPYRRKYINGHHPNGMTNKSHSTSSKLEMRKKAIDRFGSNDKINTAGEIKFSKILDRLSIKYEKQYPTDFGVVDFYLSDYDMLVEIDGVYWHPDKIENLNFQLISSVCNEINKKDLRNLYRIYDNTLDKINSIDDIKKYSRKLEYVIGYQTKILSKEYLLQKENKANYIWLIKKFFRNFDFIYPTTNEILLDIITKIPTKIFKPENKVFSNNKSNLGSKYLKANFKSYWHSSFKNKKTPVEAFYDDKILSDILKYRMGINKSNETFDISFHQIIRGLGANRYTVSFFKPVLAASIYKYFLGDNENPTVIDPCAGFGARMLGFKSIYPNGTYIGIEPNKDTYNELKTLAKNFNGIELYNIKQEDYNGTLDCDLTFTSIPYFDTEIYSNHINYGNEDNWNNTFLKPLFRFKNKLINFPNNLRKYFPNGEEYFLRNQTSHFNKNNNQKDEYILKF